jgi:ELWxxDGT repeat protein
MAKRQRRAWRLKCEALEDRTAPAIITQRLTDINKTTLNGAPEGSDNSSAPAFVWAEYNGSIYFQGNDQPPGYADLWGTSGGPELWKTDGTAAGTVLVKDIRPGFYGSYAGGFTESNGTLFFGADDGIHGGELWKTDGTATGTVMVKDIYAQTPNGENRGSNPSQLTDVNGILYFSATDELYTGQLWRSDGTAAGTSMIKQFDPPANYPGTGPVLDLTNVNGTLFFTAVDGANGRELWTSDGTAAGTVRVKDLNPAGVSASILDSVAVGDTFFFSASGDSATGNELWKSDGTTAGTGLVKDIYSGTNGSRPKNLTALNGLVYFRATSGADRDELWQSDGTTAGTTLVKQLGTSFSSLDSPPLVDANGTLYALSWASGGNQLWKSDGTPAATVTGATVGRDPAATGAARYWLTAVPGGGVDFVGYDAASGNELWHSDGTAAGTVRLKDLNPGSQAGAPANLLATSLGLFFSADDGSHGREMWKTDGTPTGTVLIKDVNTVTADGVGTGGFTDVDGQIFFTADAGTTGIELWKTDGTAGRTTLVKDIKPGRGSSLVDASSSFYFTPVALNGVLYFAADDGVNGRELWRSDGTEAGTYLVKNIGSGSTSPGLQSLTVCDGAVYFTTRNSNFTSRQLWRTDGTTSGTVVVKDNLFAYALTPVGGTLYFAGVEKTNVTSSPYGIELWKTDGTTAGTMMVTDIRTGNSNGLTAGNRMTDLNGILLFTANNGTNGEELWKSDGTAAGTVMVKDSNPGTGSGTSLYSSAVMNGILYFIGTPGLWRTDGTTNGTYQVAGIQVGGGNSFKIRSMEVLNGNVVFQGHDSRLSELWKSDGTAAGTALVKDIMNPDPFGSSGSMPALMEPFSGQIYFTADDWIHGRELWRTDGTTAGTVMTGINNVPFSPTSAYDLAAYPGDLTTINGTLYFSAEDGQTGREIWTVSVVPPAATIGPIAPNPRNAPIASIPIAFNMPVTGFDLSDLSMTRNGTPSSLAGATLTTADNTTFTLGNLSGVTAAAGDYVLQLTASGSGIKDADLLAIVADASTTWTMDLTAPTVIDVVDISPDPRNSSIDSVDLTFSEPIDLTTLTAADLNLRRDGTLIALPAGISVTQVSGSTYRVSGLSSATAAAGTYQFDAIGNGVLDLAGNAGTGSASDTWVVDTTPPTAALAPVDRDPRNSPVPVVTITFSEPINLASFTDASLILVRDGIPVPVFGLAIAPLLGSTYEITGLSPFTTSEGAYLLTVDATTIQDLAGNAGVGSSTTGWLMDTTAPAVTINQSLTQVEPTNQAGIRFDVVFSEAVSGFDGSKVTLSGSAGGSLVATAAPGALPNTFIVTVDGMTSPGTVVATIAANAVTDLAGNGNSAATSADNSVVFDNLAPTVTIRPTTGQANPTAGTSITFDVVFSEPVNGFAATDIDLSASSAPGSLVATVAGSGPTYTVTVTGMTAGGTVVASLPAAAVTDLAGNDNLASTGSQNSVTYVRSGTPQFTSAVYEVLESGSPTVMVTVTRIGGDEGPLDVEFATSDGTALAGTDYKAATGSLHWDAGDSATKSFSVQILDDGGYENDSTFEVLLRNASPSGSRGAASSATVVIHETAVLVFDQATETTTESESVNHDYVTKTIAVRRLFGSYGPISVGYTITAGTATAGSDYVAAATGTLEWKTGETVDQYITIQVRDDSMSEGWETIQLALTTPTGNAEIGSQNSAILTIAPSDGLSAGTTFTDADGDLATVKLGGKVGEVKYYLTDGIGPIAKMDLIGTDSSKSVVSIAVKKPKGGSGDGRVQIGEIDGSGVKSLALAKADLTGAGINLTSFLGSLVVGDIKNGADITLNGTPLKSGMGTKITAGVIGNGTDIAITGAPLASLTVTQVGIGNITAPSVGSITIKGKAKTKSAFAIPGDFKSNLTIAGTELPAKGLALKLLKVAGAVSDSVIRLGGLSGTVGDVGSVSVGAFLNSRLFAGYSGSDNGSDDFNLPSTIGSFVVTGKDKAFAHSFVVAYNFKNVSLASVDPDNSHVKFGFFFKNRMTTLAVKSTGFKFDAKGPPVQDMESSDFEVAKV